MILRLSVTIAIDVDAQPNRPSAPDLLRAPCEYLAPDLAQSVI